MKHRTTSRVAGYTDLIYLTAGITSLVLSRPLRGSGVAERLENIFQHPTHMGLIILLGLLTSLTALVLAVTYYALTRDQDAELAMIALVCRLIEGIPDGIPALVGQRWLAQASAANTFDEQAVEILGAALFRPGGGAGIIFFAVGNTIFAWLMLRGRIVPTAVAALGVGASLLLLIVNPLQLSGLASGSMNFFSIVTWAVFFPELVFEVWLSLWLILKGARPPVKAVET